MPKKLSRKLLLLDFYLIQIDERIQDINYSQAESRKASAQKNEQNFKEIRVRQDAYDLNMTLVN